MGVRCAQRCDLTTASSSRLQEQAPDLAYARPLMRNVRFQMPLLHFAFGGHHRSGNHDKQIEEFVQHILRPRKLRAFICPEFMPLLNNPNALVGAKSSARPDGNYLITFDEFVPAPPVSLLPCDVWMVSFVNIALSKLSGWAPSGHYGHLGIAFKNDFQRKYKVRPVSYYQYPCWDKDPLVIAFNQVVMGNNEAEKERLFNDLVRFRKPARLWPEFNEQFATLRLTAQIGGGVEIDKITYSRYEVGYDFQSEYEARWVTKEHHTDMPFRESDVLAIVVPDVRAKRLIEDALSKHWAVAPPVMKYPT